ncbi:hypothetical protein HYH03_003203 [Edaphochlamys debaryana]|uniref:Protein kinase domain-containing protein n=1 Tax=Edaphochlamys debaryana TaxID=47281 RepID=A0A836C4R7_9CHLO|nr:hypothetical protein HYH03_003203 [Edaphochlamys debaryana]|eukprot:KAG2499017.1 hypothetical protein HYH03_003203 [Edaphochlamys debaryana]
MLAVLLSCAGAHTGALIAAGLADPTVDEIVVANDIVLEESDWAPYELPVRLGRNVTLTGLDPDPRTWAALDLRYLPNKVLICPGCVLTVQHLVVRNFRGAPHFQFSGWDLFAPQTSPGPEEVWPLLILRDAAMHQRTCLPLLVGRVSIRTVPRPPGIGGVVQNSSGQVPQVNCVDSPWAPPMQRCWPLVGIYYDLAVYAAFPDDFQRTQASGYIYWIVNSNNLCDTVMADACVAELGVLGCWHHMFPNMSTFTNYTPPAPPPSSLPPGPVVSAPLSAATQEAGATGEADSGGGGSSSATLAAALGGALGGAALVALITVLLLVTLQKRRRGGPAGNNVDCGASGSDGDRPCWPPSLGNATPPKSPLRSRSSPTSDESQQRTDPRLPSDELPTILALDPAAWLLVTPMAPLTTSLPDVNVQSSGAGADPRLSGADANLRQANAGPQAEPGTASSAAPVVELLPKVLGKGSYGRVVEGVYLGKPCAVKLLTRGAGLGSPAEPRDTAELAQGVRQELEVLARCDHPNIVKLLAASLHPKPFLVMERMDMSLHKLLYGRIQQAAGSSGGASVVPGNEGADTAWPLLPLPLVLHIATEVAQGLAYLHPHTIHRDLKPCNVLVSGPCDDRLVVKLTDFGLSRLQQSVCFTATPEAGTPAYIAPECYDVDNNVITHHADIYTFGVLLWEMLAGMQPWYGLTDMEIAIKVTLHRDRLPLPPPASVPGSRAARWPPRLLRLVTSCWEADPYRRPAAAELTKLLLLVKEGLQVGGTLRRQEPAA